MQNKDDSVDIDDLEAVVSAASQSVGEEHVEHKGEKESEKVVDESQSRKLAEQQSVASEVARNKPTEKRQVQKEQMFQGPGPNDVIKIYPQETFISNCMYDFEVGKHRVLSWNMVGSIALRHEFQFTQIDVDFTNKNFHRNLGITDDFGATMACLNYSGMMLANPCQEQDEDNYEQDDVDSIDENAQRRKLSNVEFRPFNEWKNCKPWTYQFKNGESVECLAIGTSWCAVLTNYNYIRVFSHSGIQK